MDCGTSTVTYGQLQRNDIFPPYWTNQPLGRSPIVYEKVDGRTEAAIKYLVGETWSRRVVGEGRDARNLDHSRLKVLNIHRVENTALFSKYNQTRQLFATQLKIRQGCPRVENICRSGKNVVTTQLLSGPYDFMINDLWLEVNEHYLFHGTTIDSVLGLTRNGFDVAKASTDNMFGPGIYLAEKSIKADQYADPKHDRSENGDTLRMILYRVLLGNVYAFDEAVKLQQPPKGYNSVMADSSAWMFREFIVYKDSQVYPEYVITYTRE